MHIQIYKYISWTPIDNDFPVTVALRSTHLNFFLLKDILRSFHFWTPRVSDDMHCMVGDADVLRCKIWICKMLRFSEAGAVVVSNCLCYFVFCLSLHIESIIDFADWFWRHLIRWTYCSTSYFGTFGRGPVCPRTFFLSTLIVESRSAMAKLEFIFRCPERALAHISLHWCGYHCRGMEVSWRELIDIMLELRTVLCVSHVDW